ncbi:MAG: RluA family pseudouridine synthase [Spirochaetales bacterium]|jgi:23S rRNA pseudouridine1911/1915/1917 synthase|nr:RluA family pseudouridine synthase [Spirochaetales bacterium]
MKIAKNIGVVYEDENFLVLDKPAGLLTIPAPGKNSSCLTEILAAACAKEGLPWKPHPCHRLDAETSGLILFAKGKSKQKILMRLFQRREVRKTYLAFVQGTLEKPEGSFTRSLDGRPACTRYRVLEQKTAGAAAYALAEVKPETGRTNQIRLHFKAAGHPLVGETRFACRRDFPLKVKRLMLHALRLEFQDPWTGQARSFEAPLPADMRDFPGLPVGL